MHTEDTYLSGAVPNINNHGLMMIWDADEADLWIALILIEFLHSKFEIHILNLSLSHGRMDCPVADRILSSSTSTCDATISTLVLTTYPDFSSSAASQSVSQSLRVTLANWIFLKRGGSRDGQTDRQFASIWVACRYRGNHLWCTALGSSSAPDDCHVTKMRAIFPL